jgi:hypothetical protein
MPVTHHPRFTLAWEKYLETREARSLIGDNFVGEKLPPTESGLQKNRLWYAFKAGWKAREKSS